MEAIETEIETEVEVEETTTTTYVTVAPTLAPVVREINVTPMTISTPIEEIDEPEELEVNFDEYFTEADVIMMAQLIHAEAGGVFPYNRRAAVAWTVLNRLDNGRWGPTTISGIITQPSQYAWYAGCTYTDKDYEIARDVLERWATEKVSGETDDGRVLARNFESFYGDGSQNYFYDANGVYWDFYVRNDPYAC
ncbi:MAG: cell wall hydrolase [Candidatus Saccharibacteria bacterium]|nr:cell wall hydrolase [Candidatus Saccharibacteria bacterium]